MAMGKRERDDQGNFWIPTSALPTAASHPFYEQVNRILDGKAFDCFDGASFHVRGQYEAG